MRRHRISRAEIELSVADVELAERVSAQVSALRDATLAPLIARVCEELSPYAELARIARHATRAWDALSDYAWPRVARQVTRELRRVEAAAHGVGDEQAALRIRHAALAALLSREPHTAHDAWRAIAAEFRARWGDAPAILAGVELDASAARA